MEHAVVVADDDRVLRPRHVLDEAFVLDESQPLGVRLHRGLVLLVRQRADPALRFGVRDLHHLALVVERQDGMGVAVLEHALVLGAEVAVVAVAVVVDGTQRVREVGRAEDLERLGVGLAKVLGHSKAVDDLGDDRALGLHHELQVARHAGDERVVGMHRERVAKVVVDEGVGRGGGRHLLPHHTVRRTPPRVRVELADDPRRELVQRQRHLIDVERVGLVQVGDGAEAVASQRLEECHLSVLRFHQFSGVEVGHGVFVRPRRPRDRVDQMPIRLNLLGRCAALALAHERGGHR
mmetsp:Transcript_22235/g.46271  ORF Transcript_22235/g.46271 Transcript_22235/m.46271 type:complete len:294 (+) Transcript_22235:564-1445(+)